MNLLCVDLVNKFFTFTMFPFIRLRQSGGSLIYESIKKTHVQYLYVQDMELTGYPHLISGFVVCIHTWYMMESINIP